MKNLRKAVLGLGLAGVLGVSGIVTGNNQFNYVKCASVSSEELNSFTGNVYTTYAKIGVGETISVCHLPEEGHGKWSYHILDSRGKQVNGLQLRESSGHIYIKGDLLGKYKVQIVDSANNNIMRNKGKNLKYINIEVKKEPEYIRCKKTKYTIKKGKGIKFPITLSKGSAGKVRFHAYDSSVKYLGNYKVKFEKTGKYEIVFFTYNDKTVRITVTVK